MTHNSFSQYNLSDPILETLTLLGYKVPTPVQQKVIPLALQENDLVVKSKTGSGKTASFAIPICQLVTWDENLPQALVLEPTRELAVQVRDEIFHIGRKKRLKVPAVFGGFPLEKQALTLKQKSHVVVGTPGRVLDHFQKGTLHGDKIQYLIVDEADLMLDMGFIEDIRRIMEFIPENKVMMLFSATMGVHVQRLTEEYMKTPIYIEMEDKEAAIPDIVQEAYYVENEEKLPLLIRILIKENPENGMIFCATREMVNVLYRHLRKARIRCGMLHGTVDQKERLKTIEDFREGRFHYLIATDVAARGIDFDNITHVINYDFPTGKESYVHRIGRTGRNGKSGKAISLIQNAEKKMQEAIEAYTSVPIIICQQLFDEHIDTASKKIFWGRQREPVKPRVKKGAVFHKQITRLCIGGGRKSKIRAVDIVGTICNIEGIQSDDIGIIDIRDSISYVEILNEKGLMVRDALQSKPVKGKVRKVQIAGERKKKENETKASE
ncbi:DEAD/DEAH box helicase [Anaeromicropila populeti]|uniref:ATP-dependent RNA helicase DbpA n=1 Tax=Anaeromicropila populeti TaxID=37658 RepID=A0A1I6J7R2_9FIRM|nr:ATP-dependent RNA helicase DbpA [Anaeromicropila populeti]